MDPDTVTSSEPREAVEAYCQAVRTHYDAYHRILRDLGDGDAVPAATIVDATSAERLRTLVLARAPAAERQVGALVGCRLHLAEIVARYGRRFVHGVADVPRLQRELDAELARLDRLEAEAKAAIGAA